MIRDHFGAMLRAFSKPAGEELIIGTEILALLEGLLQVRALSLSHLWVKGDSTIVIPWVSKSERSHLKYSM